MIYTGMLFRAEIYTDNVYPYTDVKTLYARNKDRYPGKHLVVTNSDWANRTEFCGNLKQNGEVLSKQWDSALGFAWSGDQQPTMVWSDLSGVDNFIGTLPVIVGREVRKDIIDKQTAGVKRPAPRTWWGFDASGKCYIEASTEYFTLDQTVRRMVELGIVDGLLLDGSGSTRYYDGAAYMPSSDGRTVYCFLMLWFYDGCAGVGDKVITEGERMNYKKCIDVSYAQGVINWEKVKASGVECAMIRAGYGQNIADEQFKRNITECNRLGIPCGVYWFSYAYTAEMARKEAEYCLAAIKPYRVEMPVVWDFEGDSVSYAKKHHVAVTKALAADMCSAFCGAVETAKYYAMLYSNPSYLNGIFVAVQQKYDLWLAHWTASPDPSSSPKECGIWQYSSKGSVDGITGMVDMDAIYRDYPAIILKAGLNGLTAETTGTTAETAVKKLIDAGWGDVLIALAGKI